MFDDKLDAGVVISAGYYHLLKALRESPDVVIDFNFELGRDNPCFAVVAARDKDVWYESFITLEDAEKFCEFVGLNIIDRTNSGGKHNA